MSNSIESNVKADPGYKIRLLGFIGEDLIYGQLRVTDKAMSQLGMPFTPMSSIRIAGSGGEVKKEYGEPDVYISDVRIDGSTIYIDRMVKSDDGLSYTPVESNQIMSSASNMSASNKVIVVATEQRENIAEIQLTNEIAVSRLQLVTPVLALYEGNREITATSDSSSSDKGYSVYAKGDMKSAHSSADAALKDAAEATGLVVNAKNKYIWRKGTRDTKHTIQGLEDLSGSSGSGALYDCLDAILSYAGSGTDSLSLASEGVTSEGILEANIDGDALYLRNIELTDVLYYVSKDCPVIAATEDGSVMIVGYDTKNTLIYDPSLGATHYVGMNDSREMFEEAGNEYLTYVKE